MMKTKNGKRERETEGDEGQNEGMKKRMKKEI